jgi:hypothetical protein
MGIKRKALAKGSLNAGLNKNAIGIIHQAIICTIRTIEYL